jgi:hypothetical protein
MQSTLDHPRALAALRELQTAQAGSRPLLPEPEAAKRARAILDRADLAPFTIVEYLVAAGYSGPALYHASVGFGAAVSDAYLTEHGVRPLKVERLDEESGQPRSVCEYLEVDRPLVDGVYATWVEAR